jgi:hypothetical protein
MRGAQVYTSKCVCVCVCLYILHDINFSWKKYAKDSGYHVEEEFIAIINQNSKSFEEFTVSIHSVYCRLF